MTDPRNPIQDDEFAQKLRGIDQPVCLDADRLTLSVVAGRKRRKIKNAILITTLPGACLLIGLASLFSTDRPVASHLPKTEATEFVIEPTESADVTSAAELSNPVLQQIVLEFKQAKLKELRAEIESLKQAQAVRDWELTREVVSRSEVSAAAAKINYVY